MRIYFATTFLLVWSTALTQPMRIYDPVFETCEEALKQARIDADAGILRSVSHGLVIYPKGYEFELERFHDNYLIAKYGIESYDGGCSVNENEECYSNEMHAIILKKYGKDFFLRAKLELEEEYEKFKNTPPNKRREYINFNHAYHLPDTFADYKFGTEVLIKQLRKSIDLRNLKFAAAEFDHILVYLIVGETGVIENCKVVSTPVWQDLGKEIKGEILRLGNWKPATLYGFHVKSQYVLLFPLKERKLKN